MGSAATITLLVFWTSFFAAASVKGWLERAQDPTPRRLRRILQPQAQAVEEDLLLPSTETGRKKREREILVLAGLRRKSDLKKLDWIKRICLALPMVFVVVLFLLDLPLKTILLVGSSLFLIFVVIPRLWILRSIMKHRREIEKGLPDALDLLVLCLEAGLSFDASLFRVAEEERRVSPHLSREWLEAHHEVLAGKSREEALKNLAKRSGVEDLTSLVGAILQSIKLGTSLVRTLRVQAETLRKKRKERLRALILKTPVKLIFPLLFFIFPTLLIVILGPSLVDIFRNLDGVGGM